MEGSPGSSTSLSRVTSCLWPVGCWPGRRRELVSLLRLVLGVTGAPSQEQGDTWDDIWLACRAASSPAHLFSAGNFKAFMLLWYGSGSGAERVFLAFI